MTQRHKVSKCRWENGANRLARRRVTTDLRLAVPSSELCLGFLTAGVGEDGALVWTRRALVAQDSPAHVLTLPGQYRQLPLRPSGKLRQVMDLKVVCE